MNLNKLRTFTVVAETESISKAADILFRTQPAISTQIKELEESTNLILLERKNSRVYLTKEGKMLYDHAKQRIAELDDFVLRLRSDNENLEGTIRLGVQWELTQHIVPDIVSSFYKRYPKARFKITQYGHEELEIALLENKVDAGFCILYKQRQFFEIQPFLTFERTVVGSKKYLNSMSPIKTYKDILKLNVIGFNEQLLDYRFWLEKNNQKHLVKFVNRLANPVTVEEINTLHNLIKQGVGIGFGDNFILKDELKTGEIVKVIPKSKPIYVTIDIARRKTRTPNLLNDTFFDFLKSRTQQALTDL